MKIDCELEIIPKQSDSSSVRIVLTTCGEEVFNAYQHSMTPAQKEVVGQILATHSRAYGKFGKTLLGIKD